MNEFVKNFALNVVAGIMSSIVFVYLEKQGFTQLAYIVFAAYLFLSALVFIHITRKPAILLAVEKAGQNKNVDAVAKGGSQADPDIFHSILALIAKYHSQNDTATPTRIAADLSLAPEVTLAYMWKYHNEQFITFANGGKQPDVNTPFFLSPAAWQHIKVVRA